MALFKKKERKQEIPRLPELPNLPELPEFPETENFSDEELPQFPSFPNDSLGNKFSQNTIKEAVAGEKEVEGVEADEFAEEKEELSRDEERMRGMRKPLVREETGKEFFPKIEENITETEPIFVRIDKFEEGSKEFDEVRKKVTEIENMFENVKKIKEKEERELELWEEEIRNIKEKIEKIDRNIFSRLG